MEIVFYYLVAFVLSFLGTRWVLDNKKINLASQYHLCSKKEPIIKLIQLRRDNKVLMKEVKEYSLLKIQNGHYEYSEVLKSLTTKSESYDKETEKSDAVNA